MKLGGRIRNVIPVLIVSMIISFAVGGVASAILGRTSFNYIMMGAMLGGTICFFMVIYFAVVRLYFSQGLRLISQISVDFLVVFATVFIFCTLYIYNFEREDFSSILDFWGNHVFIYSMIIGMVITFAFVFMNSINLILGRGVMVKLLFGNYMKPRDTERIFMFLDIRSSTSIAEKIGHRKFLSLLDDFFYDISEAVMATRAEIYKYVGDEVILTWDMKYGLLDANCINCFFMIRKRICEEGPKYMKKYTLVPEFKAAVHGGPAVIGQMGYLKMEIAYLGDVLNTTARIESECNSFGESLLVSGDIVGGLTLPSGLKARSYGLFKLRGKEEEIEIFGIRNIS
jgi:adenylate cyclase